MSTDLPFGVLRARIPEPVCGITDGCITCGDVAVPLVVTEVDGADALCRDDEGGTELVATELVGAVAPGDRLLVHAGVALERLCDEAAPTSGRVIDETGDPDAIR